MFDPLFSATEARGRPRTGSAAAAVSMLLLVAACGDVADIVQSETGMQAAGPPPSIELVGELVGRDEHYDASYSVPRDRFRLDRRGRSYIGSMSDESWLLALDHETKTWIRHSAQRHQELDRAGRGAEASRYRDACRALGASEGIHRMAMAPFQHPCERAKAALGRHSDCGHVDQGAGRQRWTHRASNLAGEFIPHEKVTRSVVHVLDTTRGVVVSAQYGNSGSAQTFDSGYVLRGSKERRLEASRFEVPADYRELMTARELEDRSRPAVGWSEMVPGRTLRLASAASRDVPRPPAPTEWNILTERWFDHSREPKVEVHVATAIPAVAAPLAAIPEGILYGLGFETAWQAQTLAGEGSRRLDERSLLFTVDGALIKVMVHPEELAAERLVPLGRKIAERMVR